jgi:hypothetical protein
MDINHLTVEELKIVKDAINQKINQLGDNTSQEETLEEAAFHYSKNKINKNTSLLDFTKGAKWQAERMFSEEDMRNAFDSAREFNSLDGVVDVHIVLPMGGDMSDLQPLHFTFDDWFEQFSKLKNG